MVVLFPTVQAILSGLASIAYFIAGEHAKGVYWLAATVLTTTATFWLK